VTYVYHSSGIRPLVNICLVIIFIPKLCNSMYNGSFLRFSSVTDLLPFGANMCEWRKVWRGWH